VYVRGEVNGKGRRGELRDVSVSVGVSVSVSFVYWMCGD
jgi:hypothetical protein